MAAAHSDKEEEDCILHFTPYIRKRKECMWTGRVWCHLHSRAPGRSNEWTNLPRGRRLVKRRGSGPSTELCSTPEHRGVNWTYVFSVRLDLNQSRGVLASRLVAGLSVRRMWMVKSKPQVEEDEDILQWKVFFGCQEVQSIDVANSDTYLKKWKQHYHMLPIKASNQITSTSASCCHLNHDAWPPWR